MNLSQHLLLQHDFIFHFSFWKPKGFFFFFSIIKNRNRNFAISSECSLAQHMGKRFRVGFPIASHSLLPASRVMILWAGIFLNEPLVKLPVSP